MLIEKFTKLYGLANPKAVKDSVEKFFKSSKNVNAQEIYKLEEQIKKESLKYKSTTTQKTAQTQEKLVETAPKFEEFIDEAQNSHPN